MSNEDLISKARNIELTSPNDWDGEEHRLLDLIGDLAEALEEADRLNRSTYCAYCGERCELDSDCAEKISEHIKICDKHPMREVEAELARVKAEVPCPECHGDKKVPDGLFVRNCPTCDGTGRVQP